MASNTVGALVGGGISGDGIINASKLPDGSHLTITSLKVKVRRVGAAIGYVAGILGDPFPTGSPIRTHASSQILVSSLPLGDSEVTFTFGSWPFPGYYPTGLGILISHQDFSNWVAPYKCDPLPAPYGGFYRGYSWSTLVLDDAVHALWFQAYGPL